MSPLEQSARPGEPIGLRKIWQKVRLPTGLRGRLFLAFAGIASFAVLAAVAGLLTVVVGRHALDEMIKTRVPRALHAVELMRHSERLVATGPALLNAVNDDEISTVTAAKNAELQAIRPLLSELKATDDLAPMLTEIDVTIESLAVNLDEIATAVARRDQATSYKNALLRNAFAASRAFAKTWSSHFEAVQKGMVELERTASAPQAQTRQRLEDIDQAMLSILPLDQLQRRAADSFQLLVGGAGTDDPNELARLKSASEAAMHDIDGLMSGVDLETSTAPEQPRLGNACDRRWTSRRRGRDARRRRSRGNGAGGRGVSPERDRARRFVGGAGRRSRAAGAGGRRTHRGIARGARTTDRDRRIAASHQLFARQSGSGFRCNARQVAAAVRGGFWQSLDV
jgi:hypothetical protein